MNFISIDASRALADLDDPRVGLEVKTHIAADLVAALIEYLDDIEGDPDLEPSLGGDGYLSQFGTDAIDLEGDECDLEDDGISEPLLGSPEIAPSYTVRGGYYGWHSVPGSQEHWSQGQGNDGEEEDGGDMPEHTNEDGGDINDLNEDREASLSLPEQINQERRTFERNDWHVTDGEVQPEYGHK
jgi:hypothetical protein